MHEYYRESNICYNFSVPLIPALKYNDFKLKNVTLSKNGSWSS